MLDSVSAHEFRPYVSTSETDGTRVYVPIEGLKTVTRANQDKMADNTTFDRRGWTSQKRVSGGRTFALAGLAQRDEETGARAAGQAAVEALYESNEAGWFVIVDPDPSQCREFRAFVRDLVDHGGSTDDLATWSATLETTAKPVVKTATALGIDA